MAKLSSLFPGAKTLADTVLKTVTTTPLETVFDKKPPPVKTKPGDFGVIWPKQPRQQPKDYKAITTAEELRAYCRRCKETGYGGFDYETSADAKARAYFEPLLALKRDALAEAQAQGKKGDSRSLESEVKKLDEAYGETALDPWRSDVVAFSLSAQPHEARAVFLDLQPGRNLFEPGMSREDAHRLAFDILNDCFFRSAQIMKVAFNLSFEAKHSAKLAKYVFMPCADPMLMAIRCQQVVAPGNIKNPKAPYAGMGLKNLTKKWLGVVMSEYDELMAKHKARFFRDLDADHPDALLYACEDSDYALQQYLFWLEVARQIPKYDEWLHTIEMPFMRVIGLMEYHGMGWDVNLATVKEEEAALQLEQTGEKIKALVKEKLGLDVAPGKTGKTGDIRRILFDVMKVPVTRKGDKGPSLDEEAILDITFLLENKLEHLDEEKYLAAQLPDDWENRDPDTDPYLDKHQRQLIRIRRRQPHPYQETAIKLLALVQELQTASTLLSSHIIGRAKFLHEVSGRIHAKYGVWTETGRCNCFEPNGQNVPRMDNDVFKIRNFYVPGVGKILFFIDFSGFELRLMAWRSGDEVMIEIFRTPGGDIHRRTAAEIAGKSEGEVTPKERQDAKPANFGIAYGGTEHALQTTIKKDYGIRKSLEECRKYVDAVKRAYKRIPEYQRNIVLEARETGYVQAIYGFIRMLWHINSPSEYARGKDERRAANTPIQGGAAEIMKRAQNAVYDEIGRGTALAYDAKRAADRGDCTGVNLAEHAPLRHGVTDMIGQIHDEILFEMDDDPNVVERACAWVKAEMEKPPIPNFPVPIEAEASVGYRWGEKQKVEKWVEARRGAA